MNCICEVTTGGVHCSVVDYLIPQLPNVCSHHGVYGKAISVLNTRVIKMDVSENSDLICSALNFNKNVYT